MLLPNALLPLQPRLPPRYASAAATAVEAIFGGDGSAYAAAVQLVGRALGTTAPRLGEPPPASAALLLPRAAAALDASAARRCGCHCDAGDSSGEVCDCQRDVGSSWPSTLSSSSSKPALCRWDGSNISAPDLDFLPAARSDSSHFSHFSRTSLLPGLRETRSASPIVSTGPRDAGFEMCAEAPTPCSAPPSSRTDRCGGLLGGGACSSWAGSRPS